MRHAATIAVLICLFTSTASAQEMPEFQPPQKQHQWLQQLVGEWDAKVEMFMPGQDPVVSTGTEHVRGLGGFWTISEHNGDFMGQPYHGVMTLGYDIDKDRYVGTWVDSVSGFLWNYEGGLDKTGKVLTLTAEGQCPMAPGKLTKFKEVLEIKSKNEKVFTSSMLGEDGEWTTGMKITYTRSK